MPTARVNGVTLYYEEPCLELGLFMKRHIPHAGLVMLPMTGHTANIEEPGLFNLHIAEFLAAVENGRWGTWKAEKTAQGERRNDTQNYQRPGLMLEHGGRSELPPAPAYLLGPGPDEASGERAADAGPQHVAGAGLDPQAPSDHGHDQSVGERCAELLDQIKDHAALVTLGITRPSFRSDDPDGVGAAYPNIGTAYVAWGNQLRDARLPTEARNRYRRAVKWLVRCLEFSAGARLGEDASEAQAVLAEAYLGLDESGQTWSMACAARDAAEKSGNQLDLASALWVLGAVYRFKGNSGRPGPAGMTPQRSLSVLAIQVSRRRSAKGSNKNPFIPVRIPLESPRVILWPMPTPPRGRLRSMQV